MKPRRAPQLLLGLRDRPTWGGRRAGAGRKPAGDRAGMPHRRRAVFRSSLPAHVTLRVRDGVPSLRSVKLVRELERSWAAGCERGAFRVAQYSLQGNHAHLIVEARDAAALGCGMKAIGARLARAVNRVFGRRGPVLADRYHARLLRTPREVRNALRYVLLNARRHARGSLGRAARVDPASSGRWFDGWRRGGARSGGEEGPGGGPRPVARARTWLLRVGWRRGGLLDPADRPGPAPPATRRAR